MQERSKHRNRTSTVLSIAVAGLALAALPALAGDLRVDGSFVSTVPTGTPPLSVASTTRVDGLNADLLDGLDASAFAPAPAQVLSVSPAPGNYPSVQAALDAISDASAIKPYLIRVAPGIYVGQVTMEPYVDIEGAGEGMTFLRWSGDETVRGASSAELRDLTVENFDDGASGGVGIYNFGAAPRITRVTVEAQATAGAPVGIFNDAAAIAPAPLLRDVTVSATGPGAQAILNDGVATQMVDVAARARGDAARGIVNQNSADATLIRVTASAAAAVTDQSLVVGVVNSGSLVEMVDVDASAVGGEFNYGVSSGGNSQRQTMVRVRATAIANGGSYTYAVRNFEGDLDMTDCELLASGDSAVSYALWNNRSSVRIHRSRLTASGTAQTYAIKNNDTDPSGPGGPWSVEVHGSHLWGQTVVVSNPAKFTTRIGASSLDGGGFLLGSGTLICAGVYDDTFTFYPDTCP